MTINDEPELKCIDFKCYWCGITTTTFAVELPLLCKNGCKKHLYCESCAELYINGEHYVPPIKEQHIGGISGRKKNK
jgi:hypothetical protein